MVLGTFAALTVSTMLGVRNHPLAPACSEVGIDMKTCPANFLSISLLVCLQGCSGHPHRPANVPSRAVWVDGTFIDCSVETQSKANRCTVYKDDTGEILADGLFVLNTSHGAADISELHYAAFGNRIIYLEDARTLVQWVASERDPTNRVINDRLKALATHGAGQAIDCRKVATNGKAEELSECAVRAFADRKPFYVRFYRQGINSFGFYGFVGDADGNISEVDYHSTGWMGTGLPKEAQLLDDNHIVVMPCPKPVTLTKTENGQLTCAKPITRDDSATVAQQKPIKTTVCEIVENPAAFNNKLVRVRGHVSVNFEYSTLEGDGCTDAIWFAYGDGSAPPGLVAYIIGNALPAAEDAQGARVALIRVRLIRNSNFNKFERLMTAAVKADARSAKSHANELVLHRVTATFVGRIDGVSPEIHAAHLKRSPTDRPDYKGFGQMGLFDAQLVVQSVENDAIMDTVRLRLDSPKLQ